MLIKNLPVDIIPYANLHDTVYRVLGSMQHNHLEHMAVLHQDKFEGIISENALLEVDEELSLQELRPLLLNISVKEEEHFLSAVAIMVTYNVSIVPITDANGHLKGSLDAAQLIKYFAELLRIQQVGALILLEVDPLHYSFVEISKVVEANDAQITQLNTSILPDSTVMLVTIRINRTEVSDIVATFQRYDYNVKYFSGEELYENELKSNYDNLMNYLNI